MRAARLAALAGALLFVALATTASAAPASVAISGFAFSPRSVTINAGETVTWTNQDSSPHSARVPGVGTTATLNQGQSAFLRFVSAGTFAYDCGIHGSAMSGTVTVRAAATPQPTPVPTVRTPAPTAAPTIAPTVAPTPAETPSASPSPTATPTTAAATTSVSSPTAVAVASAEQAPARGQDGVAVLPALAVIAGALAALAIAGTLIARRRS